LVFPETAEFVPGDDTVPDTVKETVAVCGLLAIPTVVDATVMVSV
jgi:hypothetical protein